MNYDNLTNEELLKEVYLMQHKDRLLTLVCERLEMVMREAEEGGESRTEALEQHVEHLEDTVSELNNQLADQDDELYDLRKRVSELETQLDAGEY
jgi:predicted nuclease with TOPRIM domain